MRILGIQSNSLRENKPDYVSPSDMWRIQRPLKILKEKTGWKIDLVTEWVSKTLPLESEMRRILRDYDVVYFSYTRNAKAYCALKTLENHGMKIAMDLDDYLFTIPDLNPAKIHLYEGSEDFYSLQRIIEDISHITVTTPIIAQRYREKKAKDVKVLPNFISTEFYKHDKKDNGDKVVIGYCGGTSHLGDFKSTGFMRAIEKVLRLRPNAMFHAVGMPIMGMKLPKDQYKFSPGAVQGMAAWQKLFGSIDFDITTAPLEGNIFNSCKSNIKYQEAAIMNAPLVCSDVPAYSEIKNEITGLKVKREKDWVKKLLFLIDNPAEREKIAQNAFEEVSTKTLEIKWLIYKEYFERLANE